MLSPPLRAIFFDLDNTLLDHGAASHAALRCLYQRCRDLFGELSFEELHAGWIAINDRYWHDYAAGRLSPQQPRDGRMRELALWGAGRTGIVVTEEGIAGMNRLYREAMGETTFAYDGVIPMLEALRSRYTLGIISNGFPDIQRARLRASGIDRLLDHVILSEEVGAGKPDTRIFRAALDAAGVPPEETLYIGDNYVYDIRGASLAGLRTIWFDPAVSEQPTDSPEICPGAIARSIPDLALLLGVSLDLSPSI